MLDLHTFLKVMILALPKQLFESPLCFMKIFHAKLPKYGDFMLQFRSLGKREVFISNYWI